MALMAYLFLALAVQTVKVDQSPLRSGCSERDSVVAKLRAGDQVQVKFALAGGSSPCYLVSATVEGVTVQGYVPAAALGGAEEFERERRSAAPVAAGTNTGPPEPPSRPKPLPLKTSVPVVIHPDVEKAMQLMDRNQPEQALEILERMLKQYPKQPGLLTMAGMAAYRSDRMIDALAYWRESLDMKADPAVEQMYLDAKRESLADKSGQKKYGTRFILRYDGAVANSEMASTIVALLEEEFSRISSQLGCRADERIVTIVQTREAYVRTTNVAEWSAGAYDGKIRVPLVDQKQVTPETRQTFAHEIVHACLANIGHWPTWLHEGLAQKLSGRTLSPQIREQIRALGQAGKLPKLERLGSNWNGKGAGDAMVAYHVALAAVELFYEHHREFGVRNLMNNPESLHRITEDLDRRLQGKS